MSEREDEIVTVVVGRLPLLVRRGLVNVLREDRRVGILATEVNEDALERVVGELAPRVTVVGESVDENLLACLKAGHATTGVLVLAYAPMRRSERVLPVAGATCLAQSAETAAIMAAVFRVAQGEYVGSHGRWVGRRYRNEPKLLTHRQAEVFSYLSEDTPYAAIALEMKISIATVRTHARAVFSKLGVQSRRELVGRSLREWFPPGECDNKRVS
jgi:DNA-binding NarL/FixJ family response regulator